MDGQQMREIGAATSILHQAAEDDAGKMISSRGVSTPLR
jgi:hypothetical protein